MKTPRPIVIDARFLRTSTGRYIDRLLEHLQEVDQENRYVVILMRKDYDSWQPKNPNFTKMATTATQYTIREQLLLAWQLYRLRARLVHFTMPNYPLLYFKRFVVTVHDLSLIDYRDSQRSWLVYKFKHLIFRKIMWFAVHFSRRIITPTDFVKNQIAQRYRVKPEKIVRTYESADHLSESAGHEEHVATPQRYILYVGNAYPRKNLKLLVDAFATIKPRFPDAGLIFVGKIDYFYKELRTYVEEKSVPGVQFSGFVTDDTLAHLYRHATTYVFPSLSEGFGLPGLEAMQYDLPVVAARASCLPEVYGEAALYFDPASSDDLANVLIHLLNDEELQAEMCRKGREQLKCYSWRHMAEETLSTYREVARKAR